MHGLAYPIFIVSLLHGIGTGSDTGTLWATLLYSGSIFLVLAATLWRTARSPKLQVALFVVSFIVALAIFGRL